MGLVDEIVDALNALGGIARYSDLYQYLESHSTKPLSRTWQASVRARIEERSSDSQSYLGKQDLFFSVDGLGNGIWGLRDRIASSPVAVDVTQPVGAPKISVQETRIIRDTSITRKLKLLYQNKCQICGRTIKLPNQSYSEAHHIKPLGTPHNGPDLASNIIIVCPNHHAEFDYGSIGIDPLTMKIMHINSDNEFVDRLVSYKQGHINDTQYLLYHIQNIFNKCL